MGLELWNLHEKWEDAYGKTIVESMTPTSAEMLDK